jgi:hypothetical protein
MEEPDAAHLGRAGKRALRTPGGEHSRSSPFLPAGIVRAGSALAGIGAGAVPTLAVAE